MNEQRMGGTVRDMERAIIDASEKYVLRNTPYTMRVYYLHPEDFKRLLASSKLLSNWCSGYVRLAGMYLIPHVNLRGVGDFPLYWEDYVVASYDVYATAEDSNGKLE